MLLRLLYTFGVRAYGLAIRLAAVLNPKAKTWVKGRQNWRGDWQKIRSNPNERWVWFHCASLGEFEQGRNLIDEIKSRHPELKVLITFFSPSGYTIRQNYRYADAVLYLPLDTPAAAMFMVNALRPELVFWIKYELWINTLRELQKRNIPVLLVSARMDASSNFLKGPLAPLYRSVLQGMAHIFTQDKSTRELLSEVVDRKKVSVSSDTRFDRVNSNYEGWAARPEIEAFIGGRLCIMGGSVWPKGEALLHQAFSELRAAHDVCMILAPHNIHSDQIEKWRSQYPDITHRYSEGGSQAEGKSILWIDNIGMLSQLYHYADVAYVGGGWGTGLHNILEPAAFGCPILFGPKHQQFPEAEDLIRAGGAWVIQDATELTTQLKRLISSGAERDKVRRINQGFIQERTGATELILDWCQMNGLFG